MWLLLLGRATANKKDKGPATLYKRALQVLYLFIGKVQLAGIGLIILEIVSHKQRRD